MVYDRLIEMVRNSAAIKMAIVDPTNNVHSENESEGVQIWERKESVIPDLRLNHGTIGGNLNLASNTAQIDREYSWLIRTEKKELSRSIHRIEWALLCCLVDGNFENELRALQWAGQNFVKAVAMSGFSSGDLDTERTGLEGWAAVASIRLAMYFPQSSMRQFARGEVITQIGV